MNHLILAAWSLTAFAAGALHTTPTSAGDPAALGPAVAAALPKLDAIAEDLISTGAIPGLSIAIVHNDEVVYLKGFGVREVGSTDPISADTVFPLASVSKSISSTVVAALVGDRVVSWDTRIASLDPSFRLYDPYVTDEVTIRDLFAHRSGLSGDAGNDLELIGYDRLEILKRLHLLEPIAGFRETFSYSNSGITAAALAAALPTGQPWEEIAEERLFTRLGMTSTSGRFADFLDEPDHASIHTLIDGTWQPAAPHDTDELSPAGGVTSSARDVASWVRLLLGEGVFDGERVVAAEGLAETHKPMIGAGKHPVTGNPSFYGLGWSIDTDGYGEHWSHNGAFTSGVRTVVDLLPDAELGIVVLTNGFPSGAPEGIVASFYELVFRGVLSEDWTTVYDGVFKSGYQQFIDSMAAPFSVAPANPTPALPLSRYTGTFSNDYVGEAEVIDEGGTLVIALGPNGARRFPLTHFDRDMFLFVPAPETPALKLPVLFTVGQGQQAIELQMGVIGANSESHMRRVQ